MFPCNVFLIYLTSHYFFVLLTSIPSLIFTSDLLYCFFSMFRPSNAMEVKGLAATAYRRGAKGQGRKKASSSREEAEKMKYARSER